MKNEFYNVLLGTQPHELISVVGSTRILGWTNKFALNNNLGDLNMNVSYLVEPNQDPEFRLLACDVFIEYVL